MTQHSGAPDWADNGSDAPGPADMAPAPTPSADGIEDAELVTFTAPDKIVSIVQTVLSRPSQDAGTAALLAVLTSALGRRLITNRALALLPPLDEPEEWDAWLAMLVGVALNLTSDGVDLDVDACRRGGADLLGKLYEG